MLTWSDGKTQPAPGGYPTEPIGPFHTYEDNKEVWIAEKCLSVYEYGVEDYDPSIVGGFVATGDVKTIVKTASMGYFSLREPISEVIERLGWKTDLS